jgi:hypothetical protein
MHYRRRHFTTAHHSYAHAARLAGIFDAFNADDTFFRYFITFLSGFRHEILKIFARFRVSQDDYFSRYFLQSQITEIVVYLAEIASLRQMPSPDFTFVIFIFSSAFLSPTDEIRRFAEFSAEYYADRCHDFRHATLPTLSLPFHCLSARCRQPFA